MMSHDGICRLMFKLSTIASGGCYPLTLYVGVLYISLMITGGI
jgi:hypothetical protein